MAIPRLPARRFFASSLAVLDRALDESVTPKRHPVGIYLRLAQLSTCRAWHGAAYAMHDTAAARREAAKEPKDTALGILEDLKALRPGDAALGRTAREFSNRLGISFSWSN